MFEPILAASMVATISLIGVFFFGKNGKIAGTNKFMLPIAVGVFLGVVFFELIPEALRESEALGSAAIAIGFLSFYLLSNLLHTYHHHHMGDCEEHEDKSDGTMVLIGDAVHNFTDGIVIASSFIVSPVAGIATTVGIAFHEIPQEIAEFAILLRSGYTRNKALLYNFISALSVVIGTITTLIFVVFFENVIGILIGIAAGNLLYIAASDLLPQLHSKEKGGQFWTTFLSTVFGLVFISILLSL